MFTIDASVHISALNPTEPGSAESLAFLKRLKEHPSSVYSPTLLIVEVAAAISRKLDDSRAAIQMAEAIR